MVNKQLLKQARPARQNLIATVVLGFITGVVIVGQAFYLSRIVDGVFLKEATLADVTPLLGYLLALSLLRAALTWAAQITAQRLANTVKNNLREKLTSHLLALGPSYAKGERSGELTNTAVEGVEALDAYFSQYVPQLATSALIPLTILFVVFPIDTLSGWVLLLTAPLIPIFMILIGSAAKELTAKQWTSLSRMSAHFLDVLQGLTTLKLFGRSREQIAVIATISDRFRDKTMDVLKVAFMSALALELLASLSTAVVAVQIGLRLMYAFIEFQEAFFVLILAPEFYSPLRALGARFHAGMSGATAAKRIFEVLDTPLPEAASIPPPREKPALHFDIRFDGVRYTYDDGQRTALDEASFSIAAGQKVALVGPSGSGKSTIAHLLLRFIEPEQGRITVDGLALNGMNMAAWRSQVAWVPQSPHLFQGTVLENIRLARPDATLAEIEEAARNAHADEFIAAMPQGYETMIGERGVRLSGGQAQRLALARAFLKDTPFLILDEATSNLDPENEAHIQAAIQRLVKGRTVLIIAHRLSTVYTADKILVMAKGRVVETGTHRTLIEQRGLYQRLVAAYGGAV